MTTKKILLRSIAVVFFALAAIQWFSYNTLPINDQSIIKSTAGWLWTIVIAAPGFLLWGFARGEG
ncbi:hypothetical protein JNB88_05885 [Rhizobium cauense]|uniref:hypothetical protein n=1 Tax=Rhizobium cauense TaxID=1166683 RepID=UPI001C6E096B|nr:hypothetical protein [Rhizobium cauense]MBW9113178.1 hypothetical protein [Rhizobium cauense]